MISGAAMIDHATAYAKAVLAGKLLAGRYVRLACQRHVNDLEREDLRFDVIAAERVITFFSHLRLAEGQYAGKPFSLQPWQQFIVGSLFGWKGVDGFRRFRTAYIETGKGSGKTPLASGVALYCLVADGEQSAEVYSAATMRDQARICFTDAEKMVRASPSLSKRIVQNVNNLAVVETNSYFRPVSSEARGLDGHRPHCAIVDEVHEHPSAVVIDKLRLGTKSRRQSIIFEITNAGHDRNSVAWAHHEYSIKVVEGIIVNDDWLSFVCSLDPCDACRAEGHDSPVDSCPDCDDWRDEKVWLKTNPSLGVTITKKYLREQVREAIGMPSKENIVKRLCFSIWTQQDVRWLPMADWDACGQPFNPAELDGQDCYAGLDLASVSDLIALELIFPREEGPPKVLSYFWLPEDTIRERTDKGVPYELWHRQDLIRATPGNVADYDRLRADIRALSERFQIREIGFDPWSATQLSTQLGDDGLRMIEIRQGFGSLSAPSKELERRVRAHDLNHGGNAVLRWMASNVTAETDAAGNIKPSKQRSTEKIDGIVALVMALDRWTRNTETKTSVYETRGIDFIGAPEPAQTHKMKITTEEARRR